MACEAHGCKRQHRRGAGAGPIAADGGAARRGCGGFPAAVRRRCLPLGARRLGGRLRRRPAQPPALLGQPRRSTSKWRGGGGCRRWHRPRSVVVGPARAAPRGGRAAARAIARRLARGAVRRLRPRRGGVGHVIWGRRGAQRWGGGVAGVVAAQRFDRMSGVVAVCLGAHGLGESLPHHARCRLGPKVAVGHAGRRRCRRRPFGEPGAERALGGLQNPPPVRLVDAGAERPRRAAAPAMRTVGGLGRGLGSATGCAPRARSRCVGQGLGALGCPGHAGERPRLPTGRGREVAARSGGGPRRVR
mmetsp:Transcript_13746/g.48510  ORF Transcript_13746/g.48510 Transcript_13746/m.48510 type:complete len:303 (+) Transcript_13746:2546-3454(+)